MKRIIFSLFVTLAVLSTSSAVTSPLPLERSGDRAYMPWRGVMIDVSRHFFPIEELYKQVDIMSNYGLNTLHLHLTDAAGWRMEIKRYPRLTEVGAWRTKPMWKDWWNFPEVSSDFGARSSVPDFSYVRAYSDSTNGFGGYYTQEQLRDLVTYAQKKGVTIVPEIEFPGHSEEVCAAYPEVAFNKAEMDISKPETYQFMRNILTEVADVFPSPYIHCGGDETATQKEAFPLAMRNVNEIVRSLGRKMIVWDEALTDDPADSSMVIMVWRGQEQGQRAIDLGHEVIMCPGSYCYLDSYQDAPETQPEAMGGYRPLEKQLSMNNILPEPHLDGQGRLLGIQTTIFTEYVPTAQLLEYQLWPRSLAVAELGFRRNRSVAEIKQWAMHVADSLRAAGVNAFDLHHEIGERPEYAQMANHKALGCKVTFNNGCHYSSAYSGGGDTALTDGRQGSWNNNDGRWQGFCCDLDVTIDLGKARTIHEVSLPFMQITGPEIYLPADVECIFDGESAETLTLGDEGDAFTKSSARLKEPSETYNPNRPYAICTFTLDKKHKTRYINIKANRTSRGGWLFVDEIQVK